MAETHRCPCFFKKTADGQFEPTEATIGPWAPNLQHGGPPCALMAHVLQRFPSSENKKIARITIEFFGAVPLAPCKITVEPVRSGKKIELLRATYRSEGKTVLLAHAWRIKPQNGATPSVSDGFKPPELPGQQVQKFFSGVDSFPYGEALEWRFTDGAYDQAGPSTVWVRPKIPLIAGHEINGLEATVLMIDSANGISAELDILDWMFVPVDMTVGFYRHPVGPWVGMRAKTTINTEGCGQTTNTIFDSDGSIGHSLHTLYVSPR